MSTRLSLLLALDLVGTFAFALNGSLTALRAVHLDIVGVITLGLITAVGGGVLRDVLIGDVPPAGFSDSRYLLVAAAGGLLVYALGDRLERAATPITVLDAVGLSVFAVTGASKAMGFGLGTTQAVLLGTLTAVGGGTLRDVMVRQVPAVLTSGLYAIPALVGAAVTVLAIRLDVYGPAAAVVAAAACFGIRMLGVQLDLHAPRPSRPPG